MAVASIFVRSYAAITVSNVTDVQQILDVLDTLLRTTLAVGDRWTKPATDTYQSPADPVSGQFMKLAFSRAGALEIRVVPTDKDGNGFGGSGYAITPGSGTAVRIFAGPTHFFMKQLGAGDNDLDFQAYIVDPSPEAANSISVAMFVRAMRNNGGGTNNISLDKFRANDGEVGVYVEHLTFPGYSANYGGGNAALLTAGGSEICLPVFMTSFPAASLANNRGCGLVPQCVWVDQTHTEGQQIVVPIDTGVTAIFEVTKTLCESFGPSGMARLAFRVG